MNYILVNKSWPSLLSICVKLNQPDWFPAFSELENSVCMLKLSITSMQWNVLLLFHKLVYARFCKILASRICCFFCFLSLKFTSFYIVLYGVPVYAHKSYSDLVSWFEFHYFGTHSIFLKVNRNMFNLHLTIL